MLHIYIHTLAQIVLIGGPGWEVCGTSAAGCLSLSVGTARAYPQPDPMFHVPLRHITTPGRPPPSLRSVSVTVAVILLLSVVGIAGPLAWNLG